MPKPEGGAPPAAAAAAAEAEPLLLPYHHHPSLSPYGIPVDGYQAAAAAAPPPPQPYVVLLPYRRRRSQRRRCVDSLLSSSSLLALLCATVLLGTAVFVIWPSDPEIRLSRVSLRSFDFSTKHGAVTLNVDLDLKIRVANRDFFSLDYGRISVGIGYRGRPLGSLKASGGHLRAKGVTYLDARLRLSGIRVLEDAFFLIEDLARGSVLFDTTTEMLEGHLNLFGIDIPIEGRVSCTINVDVAKQTITSQNCYPD